MSGPNPPGSEGSDLPGQEPGDQPTSDRSAAPDTGETEFYSHAYSAPESEQFTSGPYVPADSSLYDYDSYEPATELVDQREAAALALDGGRGGHRRRHCARCVRIGVGHPDRHRQPRHTGDEHHHRAAGAGRDHHDDPATAASATAAYRGAAAATTGDRDGDAGAATSAAASGHRRGAPAATGHHFGRAAAPDNDHACRATPGHLLGDGHQGAR